MEELIFEVEDKLYHSICTLFAGQLFHKHADGKYYIKPIGYASNEMIKAWLAKQSKFILK